VCAVLWACSGKSPKSKKQGGGSSLSTVPEESSTVAPSVAADSAGGSQGRVTRYKGNALRRFQVKQYHLEKTPPEVDLCVEKWQVVFVDKSHRVLQALRLRDIVCWSGSGERLNLLLATYERISLKVRLDDSMSREKDKAYRPAKDAARYLEELAAAARLEGEMSPITSRALRERDDGYAVTPYGLHTLRFDSTIDDISTAILESHFTVEVRTILRPVCVCPRPSACRPTVALPPLLPPLNKLLPVRICPQQTHLPDVDRDVQLYVGEMALVVKSNDEFVESHPYHQLLSWCAFPGDGGRLSIRYLNDKPGAIDFVTDESKVIRDMMLMHTRKLNLKALDVVGLNPGGNKRNYVLPDDLPEGEKPRSPSWAVGWAAFFATPKE
jgi:hypothetical protein